MIGMNLTWIGQWASDSLGCEHVPLIRRALDKLVKAQLPLLEKDRAAVARLVRPLRAVAASLILLDGRCDPAEFIGWAGARISHSDGGRCMKTLSPVATAVMKVDSIAAAKPGAC